MRVLSRRLRSTIADFKPYLRKTRLPITGLQDNRAQPRRRARRRCGVGRIGKVESGNSRHRWPRESRFSSTNDRARRDKARSELKRPYDAQTIAELLEEFEDRLTSSHSVAGEPAQKQRKNRKNQKNL